MTNTYQSDASFLSALTEFFFTLQDICDKSKPSYQIAPDQIEMEWGQKFVRLVIQQGSSKLGEKGQRMVTCFVALEDGNTKAQGVVKRGDILKPGGYAAPAPKGVRSSVLKADPLEGRHSKRSDGTPRMPYWYK